MWYTLLASLAYLTLGARRECPTKEKHHGKIFHL